MGKRISGEERRKSLLRMIEESEQPVTGTALAKQAGVSRQVIVQDLSLLKAKDILSSRQLVVISSMIRKSTVQNYVARSFAVTASIS